MPNYRIKVNIAHPNASNAEAFLNSWEESFSPDGEGKDGFVFRSAISETRVEVLFFDSYEEANEYGTQHFNPVTANHRWNLNGAMLYVVSGEDADKVSSLASLFAGKE
jgi:hypothetical protein